MGHLKTCSSSGIPGGSGWFQLIWVQCCCCVRSKHPSHTLLIRTLNCSSHYKSLDTVFPLRPVTSDASTLFDAFILWVLWVLIGHTVLFSVCCPVTLEVSVKRHQFTFEDERGIWGKTLLFFSQSRKHS